MEPVYPSLMQLILQIHQNRPLDSTVINYQLNYLDAPVDQFGGLGVNLFDALSSISRHDDLRCVPRILCEVASGNPPGDGRSTGDERFGGLGDFGRNAFIQCVLSSFVWQERSYAMTYIVRARKLIKRAVGWWWWCWWRLALLALLADGLPVSTWRAHLPYWVSRELPRSVTAAEEIRLRVTVRFRDAHVIRTSWCTTWTITMADSSGSSAGADTGATPSRLTSREVPACLYVRWMHRRNARISGLDVD
jgi:hypothetical protein